MIRKTLLVVFLVTGLGVRVQGVCHATIADPAVDQADAAFLDGDYQRALNGYLQLYARSRESNYLHNIAGCYEKLGFLDRAVEYFARYLGEAKDLDAGARADVGRTIERLRGLMDQRRKDTASGTQPLAPPPVASSSVPSPPPAPVGASGVVPPAFVEGLRAVGGTPDSDVDRAMAARTATASGSSALSDVSVGPPAAGLRSEPGPSVERGGTPIETVLRRAGAVEAGLGVAALGLGIYFGVRSRNLEQQASRSEVFDAVADRDGQRANALQYGMYTAAGALLAGSAAFFYCGYLAGRDAARVALVPSVGPTHAGTAVAARF